VSEYDCCASPDYEVWRGRNVCMGCGTQESVVKKPTHTKHDPLCTAMYKDLILPTICSPCQLIRKVRAEYESSEIEGYPV